MAHLSQCGSFVHKKDKLRTICEHCTLVVLCQARHFHYARLLVSHKLMLRHLLKVRVSNTVPYNEVRLVDVLLSAF